MAPVFTDRALRRAPRTTLFGLLALALAGATLAGPVPTASAATNIVSSAAALKSALTQGTTPLTLGTSFSYDDADLTVSADTTLLLENYHLTTKNIIVNPGVTLTIEAFGTQGALTARADSGEGPGIETTGATLVITSGTIYASSILGHAGIGGAEGTGVGGAGAAGGTTVISGGHVTVSGGGAGIGGGQGALGSGSGVGGAGGSGGVTEITGGVVDVSGLRGAGIGGGQGGVGGDSNGGTMGSGGPGGAGGTTTIRGDAEVTAVGTWGAGIGGGTGGATAEPGFWNAWGDGGKGSTFTLDGGSVEALGKGGAGVGGGQGGYATAAGGGSGGDGGDVDIISGELQATGHEGAGIGGGDAAMGANGSGMRGAAADVDISADGLVTASRKTDSPNFEGDYAAVGHGQGLIPFEQPHPSTHVDGTLLLPGGQHVVVPSGASITGTGTIVGDEHGAGTIDNRGIITPQVPDQVDVTGNDYKVTFDSGSSQATPPLQEVRVLAPNFDAGDRDFPPNPTITANPFTGWTMNADGSGGTPTTTMTLTGDLTVYGQWTYDTYVLAPDAAAPVVGDAVTFGVEVEDGDPAGDQSGLFNFTTDAPGTTFTGNQVTFTQPGDWTVTATHRTTPAIVLTAPITVTVDRTAATTITLTPSATTLDVDGTITATATGADVYGNALGDLTDLVTISSDGVGDTVTQGAVGTPASIHFVTPGTRTITASVAGATDTVDVTVIAESYTMVADVPSPLAGDTITFSITADDGDPAGDLTADFTFETTGPGTTATGNPITLTTAGDWTATATHTISGTQVTLPMTVGTDRTTPAAIAVTLSAFSVKIGGTITATITGTDAYGNPLGDLTDLATITSNYPTDVIGAGGSIRFPTASTHVITATIGSVTNSAAVTVIPAATGGTTGLADTGAEPLSLVWTAVLLLLVGAALILRPRRIRSGP